MKKLQKLLNPLNIPCITQEEILEVAGGDCELGLEDDFIAALKLKGTIIPYKFSREDIENKISYYGKMKYDITKAKSIFIIIEMLKEESVESYKHIIDEISSAVNHEATLLIKTKIVSKASDDSVNVILFGYENSDVFSLEVGDYFAEFWSENSDYCLQEFKKMRESISKETGKSVNSMRIVGSGRSPNMIELSEAQTFRAVRVFEFNEQTKEEFEKFLQKIGITLLEFYRN